MGMVAGDIVAMLVSVAFVDGVVVDGLGSFPSVFASLEVVLSGVNNLVVGIVAVDVVALLIPEAFVG